MNYQKLLKDLNEKSFRKIYVFHGEEKFLMKHAEQRLLKEILNENTKDLDSSSYSFENKVSAIDFQSLVFSIKTPAFLSLKRLVILKNTALFTSAGTNYENKLIELLEAVDENSVLLIIEEKFEKRKKKLFQKIESLGGVIVEFEKMDFPSLQQWVRAFFQKNGITIDASTLESLIERCDRNMFLLRNEMEKCILFLRNEENKHLTDRTLNLISIPDTRAKIFDLTDYLAKRDAQNTIRTYNLLIEQGEAPIFILFMIARQFRQIIIASNFKNTNEIMKSLGIGKFLADKLYRQSKMFEQSRLLLLYKLASQTDYQIKSGQVEEHIAMDLLLLEALNIEQ